jgi:hypothetical protein
VVLVVQRLEILDKIVKQLVLSHIAALAGAAAIDSFGVDSNTANDANSTASTSAGPNNFNMYRYQTTVLSAEGVDFVRQNYSERFTMAPRAPATETYGHPSDFVIGIVNIIFSIVDASYESDENVPLLFLLSTAPTQAPAAAGSEPLNKQAMDDSTITQSRSILVSALCSLAILAYWPHNSHLIWVKTPDFPSILMTFVNTLLKRLAQIVYKISSCVDDDMRVEFLETNKELLTFLFYNYPGNKTATSLEAIRVEESTVLVQLLILLNQTDNYELFNEAAYNASWAPISYIYPESAALTNSKKWRKSSFEFCALNSLGLGNTYCSIISLNPISTTSKSVSEYFYQVKSGSCSDTFTVNASTWTTLASNPPAQFLQPYYECVMDTTNALINAAGIAQGNVATVLPFLVIAALPIMYMTLHLIGQVFVVCSFAV